MISEKYKIVECAPQTELQDFYTYLIEQLQPLPYVSYEWCTNCISENKIGPSPGIFLGLFHCCGVSVQVLSSGIINIVENVTQQCSNKFTTSTSSGFAITRCTKNVARDLAKSSNSGIASSGLERWLHNTTEETMAVCNKTRWKPNHLDMVIGKQAISFLFVLHCTSSKCSNCSALLILSNNL